MFLMFLFSTFLNLAVSACLILAPLYDYSDLFTYLPNSNLSGYQQTRLYYCPHVTEVDYKFEKNTAS